MSSGKRLVPCDLLPSGSARSGGPSPHTSSRHRAYSPSSRSRTAYVAGQTSLPASRTSRRGRTLFCHCSQHLFARPLQQLFGLIGATDFIAAIVSAVPPPASTPAPCEALSFNPVVVRYGPDLRCDRRITRIVGMGVSQRRTGES